ncbi:hypothetical protein STEG23_021674 [Scotinomys teguina]
MLVLHAELFHFESNEQKQKEEGGTADVNHWPQAPDVLILRFQTLPPQDTCVIWSDPPLSEVCTNNHISHEAFPVSPWDWGTEDVGAGHDGAAINRIPLKDENSSTPHFRPPSDVTSTSSRAAVHGLVSALALTQYMGFCGFPLAEGPTS